MQQQRREFLLKTATTAGAAVAASAAASSLVLAGCTVTGQHNMDSHKNPAVRRQRLDSEANLALGRLYGIARGSRELVARAHGVLIFPSVIAAGLFVGGQYGEGVLRVGNATQGYYSTASGSVGLQAGAQSKSLFFLFMTPSALAQFRAHPTGWSVGGDASVAVLKIGANGTIDTLTAKRPVIAFALTNSGLMANLTLEGTKVSKLAL